MFPYHLLHSTLDGGNTFRRMLICLCYHVLNEFHIGEGPFLLGTAYLMVPASLEMSGPEKDPYAQSTAKYEAKNEWNTHMIIIKDWGTL